MQDNEAIVMRSTGSWYLIRNNDGDLIEARIKGKFRIQGIKTTNPIAVGDKVKYQLENDGVGVISEIYPRKNYIVRKSVNLSKQAHIIACNVDQALLFVTLSNPVTSTGFIDRFLVTAEAYHIPVVLVFNKMDLYNEDELTEVRKLQEIYAKIGYDFVETSTVSGIGIKEVKELLEGKITMLSGHSGAGKSTLINAVDSNLDLKTGDISSSHFKGKHTTTFAEMFELEFGGFIIDTPGIKGFGLIDFDKEDLSHYFLEMRELLPECKFNNCQHINEPKCAVKKAVEEGVIEPFRYKNYLSMYRNDDEETFRTVDY